MTFDAFTDAVDDRVRTLTPVVYGVYRGPFVAFWHQHDVSVRLRAGTADDVELEITGERARRLLDRCAAEAVPRVAAAIAAELTAALR